MSGKLDTSKKLAQRVVEESLKPSDFGGVYEMFSVDESLNSGQMNFLKALYGGMAPYDAIRHAGYANAAKALHDQRYHPVVGRYMQLIAEEQHQKATMTKGKVETIFTDAVEMARTMGDPATMVRGGTEIGRLNGYYAPEVKKVELNAKAARLQSDFENLSTEDLLEMAGDDGITIVDADFEEITDDAS